MYEPRDPLTDLAQLRALGREMHPTQVSKVIDHVDHAIRVWIERSPFLTMATVGADGAMDISPKGDPAGFVKVLDPRTLVIPDRPGNHRYDGVRNILETGRIGLMFLVPNRNEVVRVNGSARLARDAELLDMVAMNGRRPDFVVLVRVEEAFYHCGKAVIRSALWSPGTAEGTEGLPTYAEAVKAHGAMDMPLEDIEARFRYNDTQRLYDE